MTKQRTSMARLATSIALVMLLLISMALPVFAAPGDPAAGTSEAAITKLLQVPYGTDVPDAEFKFEVTKVSEDGSTPTSSMPTIGTAGIVTIDFDTGTEVLEGTVSGVSTWYLESDDIFGGVTWPHAGVYEYEIAEVANTYSAATPPPTEVMTYSGAVYTVKVYVDECKDNTAPGHTGHTLGQLEITHIGVLQTKDDTGTAISSTSQVKVDPTPGGDGGATSDYSAMIFTNQYTKTNGGTDPTDKGDWTLSVSKEVDGSFSDTSFYFDFSMTITKPSLVPGTTYKAFVVEEDPASSGDYIVVTDSNNYSGTIGGDDSITFTSGTALSFKLKHGQYLVFINTPVGTSYSVSETGVAGYTAKAKVTYNGTQGGQEVAASAGANLSLPDVGNTVYTNTLYVGEAANSADFLNDRGTVTPTGISVDNLPYIVLIAVAALGLIGYVVIRSRRKAKASA